MSPIVQLESGQQLEFQKNPTPEDVDAAVSQINQNQQSPSGNPIRDRMMALSNSLAMTGPDTQPQSQSPLNLVDSIKYGLADEPGKEKLLKSKFQYVQPQPDGNYLVGDNPGDMAKVNPEGIFNELPSTLARNVGDINTMAMSILGAVGGSVGGPAGAIAGSAAGGAVGSATNKAIAKALRLNEQSPMSLATDIALDGALMGVGEGLGQAINVGLKAVGKNIAKKGMAMAESIIKDSAIPVAEQAKKMDMLANIIHFTSGWNKEDVLTTLVNGANKTLSKDATGPFAGMVKGSEPHALALMEQIKGSVIKRGSDLDSAVSKTADALSKQLGEKTTVSALDLQKNIITQLDKMKLGKIILDPKTGDASFLFHPDLKPAEIKIAETLQSYFKSFGGGVSKISNMDTRMFIDPKAKINIDGLLRNYHSISREIGPLIKNEQGDFAQALINVKSGNNIPKYGENVKGIVNYIDDMAEMAGNTEYKAAKEAFKEFSLLKEMAKEAGIDFMNRASLQSVMKKGWTSNPLLDQAIQGMDAYLGKNYGTQLAMWKAANSAQKMDANLLRFGMVLGLTGLASLKSDSVAGRIGYIGAGLTIGTPKGISSLMKFSEKASQGGAGKTLTRGFGKLSQSTLLRRLVTQSSAIGAGKIGTKKSAR